MCSQPLRVNVDDGIISNIDHILQYKHDKEEQIRGIFQLARHIAQNEIGELLADFRNKRALGVHVCACTFRISSSEEHLSLFLFFPLSGVRCGPQLLHRLI